MIESGILKDLNLWYIKRARERLIARASGECETIPESHLCLCSLELFTNRQGINLDEIHFFALGWELLAEGIYDGFCIYFRVASFVKIHIRYCLWLLSFTDVR
ncbi:hypothetical protein Bca4012_011960 [Brassica carinata]